MTSPVTIPAYLAQLSDRLVVRLSRRRRILAEVEDHLRTATAAAVDAGRSPRLAEAAAVAAFGTPDEVAATLRNDLLSLVDSRLARATDAADRLHARRPFFGRLVRNWPPYLLGAAFIVLLTGATDHLLWTLCLAGLAYLAWETALFRAAAFNRRMHLPVVEESPLLWLPFLVALGLPDQDITDHIGFLLGALAGPVAGFALGMALNAVVDARQRLHPSYPLWVRALASQLPVLLPLPVGFALMPSLPYSGILFAGLAVGLAGTLTAGATWRLARGEADALGRQLIGNARSPFSGGM